MLGSGGSGIRVAGGGFAGRQQASGVAERKFHGGDDVGERCTENGVAPKRRQLVGWPVPAENTQRAAMPGAGRQWAVHWQRRPSAGPAQAQRRPGTGQAARCVVRLRQATPTLRCHCTAAGAPPSNTAAAAADLMCIWILQRRLPGLPATGLPSAHCSSSAQRQRQWWAVPCHGALRCVAWLSGLGRFASQGAVQYHQPILLQPLLTPLRPLHHRLHRQTHPNAAARSSPAFARKALLAGQLRSFPVSALYHRRRASAPAAAVAPPPSTKRHFTTPHLIPPTRRLFFFYDTPTYVTRHDARCNGCCALRDPDRRRWQV